MPTLTGVRNIWSYPAGRSRRELRELVARVFGWWRGQATGGSTTTIVDNRLASRYADDYWIGAQAWLETKANAPAGYASWVSDFVASTGTLTVGPAFTAAAASGDYYQLFRYRSKDDIDDALNEVCKGGLAHHPLRPNANLHLDYRVDNVAGLLRAEQIMGVMRHDLADHTLMPIEMLGWRIEEDQGVLTLRLPYAPNTTDGLWIVFEIGEGGMVNDDTRTTVPADLIRVRAVVHLMQTMLADQDTQGMEKWGQQLRYWDEQLKREEAAYQRPARRARMYRWQAVSTNLEQPWAAYGLRDRFQPL